MGDRFRSDVLRAKFQLTKAEIFRMIPVEISRKKNGQEIKTGEENVWAGEWLKILFVNPLGTDDLDIECGENIKDFYE